MSLKRCRIPIISSRLWFSAVSIFTVHLCGSVHITKHPQAKILWLGVVVSTLIHHRSNSDFIPLQCGEWQYRELSLKDYFPIIYNWPDFLVNFSPSIETVLWWEKNVAHVLPVHRRNPLACAMFHLHWKSMESELDVELLILNIRHTEEEIMR